MTWLLPLAAVWALGLLLRAAWQPVGGAPLRWVLREAAESLGLGAAGGYLFFLWSVGLRPFDARSLTLALLAAAAVFLWQRRRATRPAGEEKAAEPWKAGERAAGGAIALILVAGLALLLATPLLDWDARILWALKTKFLASERSFLTESFTDPYRLHIHPRYPLLLPWLASLPSLAGGGFREVHYQAVVALLALCGAERLYRLARETGPRLGALLCVLAMILTAAWLRSLFAAAVELALLFFLLLALHAAWRWLERRRPADLVLCGLYLFACSSVKNEGVLLALGLAAGLLLVQLRRRPRGELAADLGLPAVWAGLMALWWWRVRSIPPVSDEDYLQRLRPEFLAEGLGRLPQLLRVVGAQAFDLRVWHLTWIVFPLACLWSWRRGLLAEPKTGLLAAVCLSYWLGVIGIYLLSPWIDLAEHIDVTFTRVFVPLLPLVILLAQRSLADRPRAPGGPADGRSPFRGE